MQEEDKKRSKDEAAAKAAAKADEAKRLADEEAAAARAARVARREQQLPFLEAAEEAADRLAVVIGTGGSEDIAEESAEKFAEGGTALVNTTLEACHVATSALLEHVGQARGAPPNAPPSGPRNAKHAPPNYCSATRARSRRRDRMRRRWSTPPSYFLPSSPSAPLATRI